MQYETASVLRYIEDNFGLPQLASERRARERSAATGCLRLQPAAARVKKDRRLETHVVLDPAGESAGIAPAAGKFLGDD